MRDGVLRGLEFEGVTRRAEFWWFALATAMPLALARLLAEPTGPLPFQIASLLVLLPWIAACNRRLRDAGLSPVAAHHPGASGRHRRGAVAAELPDQSHQA